MPSSHRCMVRCGRILLDWRLCYAQRVPPLAIHQRVYQKMGKKCDIRREPFPRQECGSCAPKRHPTLNPDSRITPYTDAIKPDTIGLTQKTRVIRERSVVHDTAKPARLRLLLHIYPSSTHRLANFLNQLPLFAGPALASRPSKVRTGPPFSYPA